MIIYGKINKSYTCFTTSSLHFSWELLWNTYRYVSGVLQTCRYRHNFSSKPTVCSKVSIYYWSRQMQYGTQNNHCLILTEILTPRPIQMRTGGYIPLFSPQYYFFFSFFDLNITFDMRRHAHWNWEDMCPLRFFFDAASKREKNSRLIFVYILYNHSRRDWTFGASYHQLLNSNLRLLAGAEIETDAFLQQCAL